ncbi:solute carrier family 22 member 7b.1 [Astyanax mexicanus]|uniref:Solute carrier family 22 member 6 n=1 Tax=Astyanax mexicanus TaxID=7994 RepID=A0A8B9LBQ3_ASTMX|nr:solute carrier family 22 member 7b.1 [Astyanax mexicanus]KAG9268274.1 solute carrier family 22 member 7-like [Astyanax mexicanus]
MKFENLLAEVGGFGPFQIGIILMLVIPRVSLPFHFLLNNFIAAIPDHHCDFSSLDTSGVFETLSQEQRLTVSIPQHEDGSFSSCHMFSEPQFHLLTNSSNSTELPVVQCQNGWVYDNSTFKSTLASEWNLVCDKKSMNKATATIFFSGVMVGAAIFGSLSDRFGRKPMLMVSFISAAFFSVVSAFSTSYIMFAVMRFFTGMGITGISIISIVLCVEWSDIKHRTIIGVMISLDWSTSTMILPGIAYLVNEWRFLVVTVTSPLFLAIIVWRWIPESARWLIANGRLEEAHYYLSKCASANHREKSLQNIKPQTLATVIVSEGDRKYTYLDLLRTPKLRKLAVVTGITWFGVAFTYYGISLNVDGFGLNLYLTQFIYGTIELPAKLLIYLSLQKLGRRYSQVGTLILTGVCIAITIIIPKVNWLPRTAVAVLGKGFSEASFTSVFLYTTELYPTVIRQNGLGFCSCLARVGVSVAPLVSLLQETWTPLPQVLFCSVAILAGLLALLLPETHNVRLPETIEDVEQTRKRSICIPDHLRELQEDAAPLGSDAMTIK